MSSHTTTQQPWQRMLRHFVSSRANLLALTIVGTYTLVALLAYADLIVPGWNRALEPLHRHAPPSWQCWAGTDYHGRSVLAKAIKSTQYAMTIGFLTSFLATLVGLLLGALAGYYQGWVDHAIMWVATTIASVPTTMLLIALTFTLGRSPLALYTGLVATFYTPICRLVRAEVLQQRTQPYIQAATAIGAGHMRKLWIHILPNIMHTLILQFSLTFQSAIKMEVILSFLGLGPQTGCSWGTMIGDARLYLPQGYWWEATLATAAMSCIVLALNILGEGIREAFDPTQHS